MKQALLRLHRFLLPPDPWVGWMPYLWLIYLGFFYIKFFFAIPPWPETAATVLATGLFLFLYFSGFWRTGWPLVFNSAAITAIGAIMSPINIGAAVFFIYAGAFTAFVGKFWNGLALLFFIMEVVVLEILVFELPPGFWIPAAIITPIIALANHHFASMARKEQALKVSRAEAGRLAQVAERERIGRDLHDLLGHTLSVITLKSELAGKLLHQDPDAAAKEIREVEAISRQSLSEVREAVTGIRHGGFRDEVDHARQILTSAGVEPRVSLDKVEVSTTLSNTLAFAVREAVTNVIRHAKAKHCDITSRHRNDAIELAVSDDGRGGKHQEGFGLSGMRDRVEALDGQLSINTDQGTRLQIVVPMERGAATS